MKTDKRDRRGRSRIVTIVIVCIFLAGVSLLLYPTVSDFWNRLHQSRAIIDYTQHVDELKQEDYDRMWGEAEQYNEKLRKNPDRYVMTEEDRKEYDSLLNVSDTGIMCYIDIPAIDCSLPIYHGTDDAVLQNAVGHLEGSSLPVGGEGTHCVISGHRGLPSARLFTDLDKLKEGDVFLLQVLERTLTYEVDQIVVVEPEDMSQLEIVEGEDLCTLVTCTPYGINTHRLLVRGHRIPNREEDRKEKGSDFSTKIPPAAAAAVLALSVLAAGLLVRRRRRTNKEEAKQ
mgnify:FL=1